MYSKLGLTVVAVTLARAHAWIDPAYPSASGAPAGPSFAPETVSGYPHQLLWKSGMNLGDDLISCPEAQGSFTVEECRTLHDNKWGSQAGVTEFFVTDYFANKPSGCFEQCNQWGVCTYKYNNYGPSEATFGYFDGYDNGKNVAVCKCPDTVPYDEHSGICGTPPDERVYSYPKSGFTECGHRGGLSKEECEKTAARVQGGTFTEVDSGTDYYKGCSKMRSGDNYFWNAAATSSYNSAQDSLLPKDVVCHCSPAGTTYDINRGLCLCDDKEKQHSVSGHCNSISETALLTRSACDGYTYTTDDHDDGSTPQYDAYIREHKSGC